MSLTTHEKLDGMRVDDTVRFPMNDAIAAFADDQSLGRSPLPPNFERFARGREATHWIRIEGDFLVVTRKA